MTIGPHLLTTFHLRTVKDGECLAVWDAKGDYKTYLGPQRVWLQFSRVQFMNRQVADAHQYLEIRYRSGKKEHKRGPLALFEDPVLHESVEVCSAVTVDAFETIVVYEEGEEGEVKRNLVTGPTVFVPSTNQWLHIFKWHGTARNGADENMIPGALQFTKLRTIPDQFYFSGKGVRTKDDATLTVKVMVFYSIVDIELMLNTTHDPIGDFINALLADLMNFGSRETLEGFVSSASKLSELESFPVLCSRAAAIGFKIGKVVYRGYSASETLQSLSDSAIKARTEMKIAQEKQEQQDKAKDREIKAQQMRGDAEREEARQKTMHILSLEAESHQAAIKKQKDKGMADLDFLSGLKDLGVDLTQYLISIENAKAREEKKDTKQNTLVPNRQER